jgi:photosystem II stability/assembly factor-like uncharacterized protein
MLLRFGFGRAASPFAAGIRRGAESAPYLIVALLFALACFPSPCLFAETSEPALLAPKSLLLDVTRAGNRLVAVGDRGHVLLSDDEGVTWRQVVVPTRAMLTGVAFGDSSHGWAVGHDGMILATTDAGATWSRQKADESDETVFLDVLFTDAVHGFAVGAYGKCLATADGGKTWTTVNASKEETHFNHIASAPDGALYLSGESGTLLASRNRGRRWSRLEVSYEGSLFGLLPLSERDLIVYGLRGNVYASSDRGKDWTKRETALPVLIMADVKLKSGVIVLAGQGGTFYVSRDAGATFSLWQPETYTGGISGLLEAADGALVVVGEKGVARLQLPAK